MQPLQTLTHDPCTYFYHCLHMECLRVPVSACRNVRARCVIAKQIRMLVISKVLCCIAEANQAEAAVYNCANKLSCQVNIQTCINTNIVRTDMTNKQGILTSTYIRTCKHSVYRHDVYDTQVGNVYECRKVVLVLCAVWGFTHHTKALSWFP